MGPPMPQATSRVEFNAAASGGGKAVVGAEIGNSPQAAKGQHATDHAAANHKQQPNIRITQHLENA